MISAPYALSVHDAGLCVVPPCQDGSKRPIVPWKRYETERPTRSRVERWYGAGLTGIGIVCGPVSGNLIMLEAETADSADQFRRVAAMFGIGEVVRRLDAGYLEQTPGGGVHWLLRCSELGGNTKLARRPKTAGEMRHEHDRYQVLMETRETGGFTVVAPSHGRVHPSGKPYILINGSVDSIPVVTPEEKEALWRAARDLDEIPAIVKAPKTTRTTTSPEGDSVADRFNAMTTWAEILEPFGWSFFRVVGANHHWARPGKTRFTSATINEDGNGVLYVFSSSTPFEPETGYSKFHAYSILRHDGDMSAAARTLRAWWSTK